MFLKGLEVGKIKYKNMLRVMIFLMMISGLAIVTIQAEELNYNQLFTRDQVVDVKIELEKKYLKDIYKNPILNEYYPASVDYAGHFLNVVGIRIKNNSNFTGIDNMESKGYSFKLKFDEYVKGQNLIGLTTVNLNSNSSDPSYLREHLSYQLMEDMGVPTPEFSFVNLYINGELQGFYLAVQQIDEVFINNNFKITDGDLYKVEGEGSDLLWKGDDIGYYGGIKYKNSKNTEHHALLNMLNELNNGTDYERYLNVDEILRYFAVSTVLFNTSSYQGIIKDNYYLYEENGVFSVLPWDLSMSFGSSIMRLSKEQMISSGVDEPTMVSLEERPLFAKLLKVPRYKERYHQYIEKIITTYLEPTTFEKQVTSLLELIKTNVKKDPGEIYTMDLLTFVMQRTDSISKQLSGDMPDAGDGSGIGIIRPGNSADDFEQFSSEVPEEITGNSNTGSFSEDDNAQKELETAMMTNIDIIMIKYFDILSTLVMLIIMMILSILFLKRKI